MQQQSAMAARTAASLRPWAGRRLPVSSPYGWRVHPLKGTRKFHHGIDVAIRTGTPVRAYWPGRVIRVDVEGVGRGKDNGNAAVVSYGPWTAYYLHLSRVAVVPGQWVGTGQLVGWSGATGPVTGPHLHLSLYHRGRSIDPSIAVPPGLFTLAGELRGMVLGAEDPDDWPTHVPTGPSDI